MAGIKKLLGDKAYDSDPFRKSLGGQAREGCRDADRKLLA
jgi:hypothetical protein